MDTTAATTIGAAVAVYVQLLKIAKPNLEPAKAMQAILIMSIIGVGIWVFSQTATSTIDQSWAFGIFTAIANVSLAAAGTYGLITSGVKAVNKFREDNPTDVDEPEPPARSTRISTPPPHGPSVIANPHTPPEPTRPAPNTSNF